MPVYDYSCTCGTILRDEFVRNRNDTVSCPKCRLSMNRRPAVSNARFWPAEGLYLEHVSPTGETFHSEAELRLYAKQHNLELGALL